MKKQIILIISALLIMESCSSKVDTEVNCPCIVTGIEIKDYKYKVKVVGQEYVLKINDFHNEPYKSFYEYNTFTFYTNNLYKIGDTIK